MPEVLGLNDHDHAHDHDDHDHDHDDAVYYLVIAKMRTTLGTVYFWKRYYIVLKKRQTYQVPFFIYMASIPGPSCFEYGKHVWSAT